MKILQVILLKKRFQCFDVVGVVGDVGNVGGGVVSVVSVVSVVGVVIVSVFSGMSPVFDRHRDPIPASREALRHPSLRSIWMHVSPF